MQCPIRSRNHGNYCTYMYRKLRNLLICSHATEVYIVRGGWKKEAQRHPKLEGIGSLMEQEYEGRGMMVKCKRRRRRLVKLRGGTADNVKVTVVMDRACRDEDVGRAVERVWQRRFAAHGPHPSRHRCI